MTTYIALLRGVNVGGHRRMKMADLKALFAALGFQGVETYIQSGNVVFQTDEAEEALRSRIEREIEARFGFAVTTILRTAAEMEQVIANSPYPAERLQEGESLYVAFLPEAPAAAGSARLLESHCDPDEYRVDGREVYLLYRRSMADTKLTNNFLEKKLGVPATSRNWQTTVALARMGRGEAPTA